MIAAIIEVSARHRVAVVLMTLGLLGWAVWAMRNTPLDAVPDLSDPQVIVYTEWMGRSPDLVEDQITYPLVRALQSTPQVETVRGYSMFGMSFVYIIFDDRTDLYWARTRVLEQLDRVRNLLPPEVTPILGPDATGVGWVYQYVLEDATGRLDLAELRELQDFTIRPALQAVPGVAEVASLGGFERQYQIMLDPERLASFGLTVGHIIRAVQNANSEVGARVLEFGGREYTLRGRGYVRTLEDIETSVVMVGPGGTPIRISDVARVGFGPEIRRGAADWNGLGEAVGGIVVMRIGSNALDVNDAVERAIVGLSLPEGVRIVPTYERASLIRGSVGTLVHTLVQAGIIVAVICMVFLFHFRSLVVALIVLPTSLALSFIPLYYLGLTTNIMSLAGFAIAIGTLTDATIVLIDNAHQRIARAPADADRSAIIIDASKEVGPPIFFSLLLITASFLPIFMLPGQSGRLFEPLAYTKTFAMFAATLLSVTLIPAMMVWLLRGKIRAEADNPTARILVRLYRPLAVWAVRHRVLVVGVALAGLIATVPIYTRLGSEFMPPLDEGSLLVMPVTFPGISIEEARRVMTRMDRIIKDFPEVAQVHGKVGRAETATDPAQLDMLEIVVMLKPRSEWPSRRSIEELSSAIDEAVKTPGFQNAIAPPIRTRIDMLSTGVRTPVGVKVLGENLLEIERISIELEGLLREVAGTRSTFAERQTGREYLDIVPDRDAIARYGLTVRDVHDLIEAAVGGMPVASVIDGRSRFGVNVRYGADFRASPESLRNLLVPVPSSEPVAEATGNASGWSAPADMVSMAAPTAMGPSMSRGGMEASGASTRSMRSMSGSAAGSVPGMASRDTGGEPIDAFRQPGATVPLGELASVQVVSGPPMIKDEDGWLVGYVFADPDTSMRDLGGWVNDAKRLVEERLELPAGYRVAWTGQYEFMIETQERLKYVLPLTAALILGLLYLAMRRWQQTLLVFASVPFAVAGSLWLLFLLDYNMSTAVWVGIIAVAGLAAETGVIMVVYLDSAYRDMRELTLRSVDNAVADGATLRVRPLLMTVATDVLALMPLLWSSGVGADVAARTAAPVVGGVVSCLIVTLFVIPAAYSIWRHSSFKATSWETSHAP